MNTTAERKLQIIEEILATDNLYLLEEIKSLLHRPAMADYEPKPMSMELFNEKFEQAELAIERGETKTLEEVRKLASGWARR